MYFFIFTSLFQFHSSDFWQIHPPSSAFFEKWPSSAGECWMQFRRWTFKLNCWKQLSKHPAVQLSNTWNTFLDPTDFFSSQKLMRKLWDYFVNSGKIEIQRYLLFTFSTSYAKDSVLRRSFSLMEEEQEWDFWEVRMHWKSKIYAK